MSVSEAARGVLVTEDFLGNALLKRKAKQRHLSGLKSPLCDARVLSQRGVNLLFPLQTPSFPPFSRSPVSTPYLDMSSYSIPQRVFLSLTTAAGMPGREGECGSE